MMPFYRKSFYKQQRYNWVYSCNSKVGNHGWVPEHTLVAEHMIRPLQKNEVVHHIDFNGKNNLVENLQILDDSEHQAFHARHNNQKLWTDPEYRIKMSEISRRTDNKHHWNGSRAGKNNPAYFEIPWEKVVQYAQAYKGFNQTAAELNVSAPKLRRTIKEHGYSNWGHFITGVNTNEVIYDNAGSKHPFYKQIPWDTLVETALRCKTAVETARQLNVTWHKVMDDVKRAGYNDWQTFIDAYDTTKPVKQEEEVLVNHKIKSIEPYGIVPVYDLTVPGYKNFATDTIFSHNTPEIGAALDLYMEETCTSNESGQILQIYSESTRIKNVLEELFYDVLDISANLPPWTRNIPVRENSPIPLLNGTIITIKEIAEQLKSDPSKEIWTYSIQDVTHNILPSKIVWCNLTRKNSELYRITLDDGTFIDTAPDHEFMLRNGKYERADNLKPNTSLMPFYTKISHRPQDCIDGYEKVYNPMSDYYKFTHTAVAHECIVNLEEEEINTDKFVTHHIDFNKTNNEPPNLKRLTVEEHLKLHNQLTSALQRPDVVEKRMLGIDKYLRSDERKNRLSEEMSGIYPECFRVYNDSELHAQHNQNRSVKMHDLWNDPSFRSKTIDNMTMGMNDDCFTYLINFIKNKNEFLGLNQLSKLLKTDENFIQLLTISNPTIIKNFTKALNATTLNKLIYRKTSQTYYDFICSILPNILTDKNFIKAKAISKGKKHTAILNHKVLSVEKLSETSDVYCMEVVGQNGEQDRHNFPICGRNIDGNYDRNGVFVSNCKYGDNFVYLKVLPGKGIVGCKQLPNIEITRVEPDFQKLTSLGDLNREPNVKFFWKNKDLEFNTFEVAHFRLLGDDRRLPYGTSMLDKARRIWKQLVMSEDAMLTYRVSRAAERRVYKVFVGNMDDKDVDAYIDKVANNFRRTPVIDQANGQMDLRYNMISVDQDIFVPLRDPALPMPIETLPGAQNLDQIADIKFIQRKLLTALRIPIPFIWFEDTVGEGKNLAMMDIRFARTVYRIQKAMIQELNKIAIIHLYLKGFEDELSNFTLTLTNPSTQQDLLKIERWREKVLLYRDAVTAPEGSFAAMSATKAKKEILDMSDDEIKLDIQRQAVERAAAEELKILAETIKQTGVFKDLYDIYNVSPSQMQLPGQAAGEAGNGGGGISGGSIGGGGLMGGGEMPEETPPPEGTTGATESPTGTAPGEEETPTPEEEPLKEQIDHFLNKVMHNGSSTHFDSKRLSERFERRNFAINEDVSKVLKELDVLDKKKTEED
jgi:hypothetical protein